MQGDDTLDYESICWFNTKGNIASGHKKEPEVSGSSSFSIINRVGGYKSGIIILKLEIPGFEIPVPVEKTGFLVWL